MFQTGDPAPHFTLQSDEDTSVSLSDFRGQRVVLFFYPKADTPGCTIQACGFRDNFPLIEAANAVVLGISPDSPAQLAKWRAKQSLPYTLLSDPDHAVAEAYGVWGEKSMYGKSYMGIIRSHFVIDEEGRVAQSMFNVKASESAEQALAALG